MEFRKLFTLGAVSICAALLLNATSGFTQGARESYNQGVSAFKEGKYELAAESFRRAYQLRPSWKLLYNLGQSEAAAKHYGLALESFEAYFVEGGDEVPDDRREYVSAEIRRMQPLIGVLEVTAPDDVDVYVDGTKRATTPLPGPLRIAAGLHQVVLTKGNKDLLTKSVQIAGGMTSKVDVNPKEETPEPKPEQPKEDGQTVEQSEDDQLPEIDSKKSPLKIIGWIGVGVGSAVAIGGGIAGGLAVSKNNEADEMCPDEDCAKLEDANDLKNSSQKMGTIATILIPTGAAIAATGLVLLIVDAQKEETTDEVADDKNKVTLIPALGPGLTGLFIQGRF